MHPSRLSPAAASATSFGATLAHVAPAPAVEPPIATPLIDSLLADAAWKATSPLTAALLDNRDASLAAEQEAWEEMLADLAYEEEMSHYPVCQFCKTRHP